jgi:hypothetical protein
MTPSDVIRRANRFSAITVDLRLRDPSTGILNDSSNRLEHLIPMSDCTEASTWWNFIALFFGDVTACASGVVIGGFSFQSPYLTRNFRCRPTSRSQSPEDLRMPGTAVSATVARDLDCTINALNVRMIPYAVLLSSTNCRRSGTII